MKSRPKSRPKAKKNFGPAQFFRVLLVLIVSFLILGGFGAAYILSQSNQDLRNQAFTCAEEGASCGNFGTVCCPGLTCERNPEKGGKYCVRYSASSPSPRPSGTPLPSSPSPVPSSTTFPSPIPSFPASPAPTASPNPSFPASPFPSAISSPRP